MSVRPLRRLDDVRITEPTASGMAAHRGAFCSICEQPIGDFGELWDARTRRACGVHAPSSRANDLLVLCGVCIAAERAYLEAHGEDGRPLLLPHRARTFALGAASRFTYALTDQRAGDEMGPAVLVRGDCAEADNTIARFGLNLPAPDAPVLLGLALVRRVEARTRAWRSAERLVAVAAEDPDHARLVAPTYGLAADSTGFVSVWMTVVYAHYRDRAAVRSLFNEATVWGLQGTSDELWD